MVGGRLSNAVGAGRPGPGSISEAQETKVPRYDFDKLQVIKESPKPPCGFPDIDFTALGRQARRIQEATGNWIEEEEDPASARGRWAASLLSDRWRSRGGGEVRIGHSMDHMLETSPHAHESSGVWDSTSTLKIRQYGASTARGNFSQETASAGKFIYAGDLDRDIGRSNRDDARADADFWHLRE